MPITLADMVDEVRRLLQMRAGLYPQWKRGASLATRNMLDRQFDVMKAVLHNLEAQQHGQVGQRHETRSDGLMVHKLASENWAIRHHGQFTTRCPCCDKPFPSLRSARACADAMYPLPDDDPPAAA